MAKNEEKILNIVQAKRLGSKILIAIHGESGSGKTLSALLMARGIVGPEGKIALLDTENKRGLVYTDDVPNGYLHADLTAPFTPERYTKAIKEIEESGADIGVLDSASHEWEGIGGLIEIADAQTTRKGDPLTGLAKWSGPKGRHKKFYQRLIRSNIHWIILMRSQEKLAQEEQFVASKNKIEKVIVSKGYFPIQEKRFKFDMTVQLFMPQGATSEECGRYKVEKCPRSLLPAFPDGEQTTIETGERIREWLDRGGQIDGELEALRKAGEEAADEGRDAFLKWWNLENTKKNWEKLKPFIGNFQSIAKEADDETARRAEEERLGAAQAAQEASVDRAAPFAAKAATPPPEEALAANMEKG